ncbi:MAG: type I 3-dehydroquinate dehydratase [Ruminococcus sp.]|jgi:3-dehydroquinate dehydratase-1
MMITKKTAEVKNAVIGGNDYVRFISIAPSNAGEMKNQIQEAAQKGEAGIEVKVGNLEKISDALAVLTDCKDILGGQAVILNLDTTGYDMSASEDEKLQAADEAAKSGIVDIIGAEAFASEKYIAAMKKIAVDNGRKLMLSYINFDGIAKEDEIIHTAKAAETKGADMIYLAYMAKDDPDVIVLGYAAKKIAAGNLVSVPTCVFPMGEVGFQTRILSERCGNNFGFYHLVEPEGGLFESYEQYKAMYEVYGDCKKIQSKIQFNMGENHIMGGEKFIRCFMLKERTKNDILEAARNVARYNPEMVEWRVDYCLPMDSSKFTEDYWKNTLKEIKEILPDVPMLMTFRVKKEGGKTWYPDELRLKMAAALVSTGLIEYCDCEIDNDINYINTLKDACVKSNTKFVVSQHKWTETPSNEEIEATFRECVDKGADLPKFYLMATNYDDAVRTSVVTKKLREEELDMPIIICAMGDTGLITRTLGGCMGADFEFIDVTGIKGGEEEDVHYVDQLADIFEY